ncbi:MAG: ral nucleoside transport system permease protein, partial [Solirubrobacterales bacterium]|nr:ral nucleoside transport system permease protein [Solirubrobacterales bacterium]
HGSTDFALSVAVAVAALGMGMLFITASGASLSDATEAFVEGGFGTRSNFANTLSKTIPLVFVALGWIVVFRAGRFHVGFPGQILIGGLFVSVVALELSLPAGLHLPLAVLAGALGGAAWAGITAWLWAKRGVNEILSTLLLNLIAIQVISWIVRGPLQQPDSPLPISAPLADSARWPDLLTETTLKLDFLLIPLAVVGVAFLLARTTLGFRIRLVGTNPQAARFAGLSPTRTGVSAILISGALAGLAGSSLLIGGGTRNMTDQFDAGYGFQGIAVALLARNSPWGVLPAALLFATLRQGGGVMEATAAVSSAVVDLTQGIVILLVLAATSLLHFARRDSGEPSAQPLPPMEAKAA